MDGPRGLHCQFPSLLSSLISSLPSQVDIGWESVARLSHRASVHYRTEVEDVVEERMGTCARLKAAQRIIRMDSMIVEANVHMLERESVKVGLMIGEVIEDSLKAREDVRYEMQQIQAMNQQLKKENRSLKAEHLKLEHRVEALETKLRSISRMLS